MHLRERCILGLTLILSSSGVACSDSDVLRPVGTCSSTAPASDSPIAHGRQVLDQALASAASVTGAPPAAAPAVRILVAGDACAPALLAASGAVLSAAPESYAIMASGGETVVIGSDATGAMYGAMELAERVTAGEALPPAAPITNAPDMKIRAANLLVLLPIAGETDADWWFYDQDFWTEYLDMMARARLDILDLYGMYVLATTAAPNALLYFANSQSFPDVGAPQADRDHNVAMLRAIVAMAAARGIKVSLLTTRSDLSLDALTPGPDLSDDDVGTYTREAAADLARSVPDLWRIGFRIWESTHPPDWYVSTFVAGLRDSNTNVGLYTRSWGTAKGSIIDIVNAAAGPVVVENKYNGEQLGAPYVISGGLFSSTGFWNYSYSDYLEAPDPYIFVFQVLSGGTHRLFRHASYARIQGTVAGAHLGAAQGISLEAAHAYYPERDNYHALPADRFSPWTFRRDELEYLLFGRLAYDPSTPEPRFRAMLSARTGTDALWDSVQAASDIVPWIQSTHTCGPDQRHFAPDLEWGGTVGYWAKPRLAVDPTSPCDTGYHGPFDTLSFAAPLDAATDLVHGRGTSMVSPLEVARIVLHDADVARAAATAPIDPTNGEARDVARECVALADLGDYFGHKLRAATALAVYGQTGAPDYLAAARAETTVADAAWTNLATDTAHIAPFVDIMRMSILGWPTYHWSLQVPHLPDDPASIDTYIAQSKTPVIPKPVVPASTFLATVRGDGPGLLSLHVLAPAGGTQGVEVRFEQEVPPGAQVSVLWKEFSGFADWNTAPTTLDHGVYRANLAKADSSGFFAVEVVGGPGVGWRYPDVMAGAPYVVVAP